MPNQKKTMRCQSRCSSFLPCRPLLLLLVSLLLSFTQLHATHASMRQIGPSHTQNSMPGRSGAFARSPAEMPPVKGLSGNHDAPKASSDEMLTTDTNHVQPPIAVLRMTSFMLMLSLALVMFSPASALIAQLGADRATSLLSMLSAGAALVEITLSPALGSLIDSIGRKPVMTTALMLLCLVNAVAAANSSSIVAICLAKFVGLLGMSWFFISNQAVIGDIASSDPSGLSSIMGVQMATVGLGFFFGALVAGRLAEVGGLSLSYGASAAVGALTAALVATQMPETLSPSKRVPFHAPAARKMIRQAPLSCTRLLLKHGRQVQTLAILLLFQTLPMVSSGGFIVLKTPCVSNECLSSNHDTPSSLSLFFTLVYG